MRSIRLQRWSIARQIRPLWIVAVIALLLSPIPLHAQPVLSQLDFEDGSDAQAINSPIPGLLFTATDGATWVYGDVRTKRYNAPHPESCLDRPAPVRTTTCEYAVDGNGFAWMGVIAGTGRIDFTQASATIFQASFSTGDPLTVAGYNRKNAQLAAQVVAPNSATGHLSEVQLTAPDGETFAYILISGAPGRWLMDNLAVDVATTSPQFVDDKPRVEPAMVTVGASAEVIDTSSPDTTVALSLIITNRGAGRAKDTTLTLPFDPKLLRLIDMRGSTPQVWVSRVEAGVVDIRTGSLDATGGVVSATLRFTLTSLPSDEAPIALRPTLIWTDGASGGSGAGNAVLVSAGGQAPARLSQDTSAGSITFHSSLFAPHEPVAFWYDTPAGQSIAVERTPADGAGFIQTQLALADLTPGDYRMVAHGLWSGLTLVAPFSVSK